MDFVSRFKSFYAQPYNPKGSAFAWFLFIGFLILCSVGWSMILRAIHVER